MSDYPRENYESLPGQMTLFDSVQIDNLPEPRYDDAPRDCRKAAVLAALRQGPMTTSEMLEVSSHRFATDLDNLRKDGWVIKSSPAGKGVWCYELKGYQPKVRLKKGMQDAYYASFHWRAIRQRRLEFDKRQCCQCGATGSLEVHHWRYELFAECVETELMTLCSQCHGFIGAATKIAFPASVSPEIFARMESLL